MLALECCAVRHGSRILGQCPLRSRVGIGFQCGCVLQDNGNTNQIMRLIGGRILSHFRILNFAHRHIRADKRIERVIRHLLECDRCFAVCRKRRRYQSSRQRKHQKHGQHPCAPHLLHTASPSLCLISFRRSPASFLYHTLSHLSTLYRVDSLLFKSNSQQIFSPKNCRLQQIYLLFWL